MVLFVSMTSSIIQMGPLLYSTSGSGLPPKLAFSLGARCSWLLVDFHVPAYCNTVRGTIPAELLSMCRPFSFCTALHCLHRSSNDALRVGSEGWVQPIRLVSAPWFHCSHLPTLWFFLSQMFMVKTHKKNISQREHRPFNKLSKRTFQNQQFLADGLLRPHGCRKSMNHSSLDFLTTNISKINSLIWPPLIKCTTMTTGYKLLSTVNNNGSEKQSWKFPQRLPYPKKIPFLEHCPA